VSIVTCRRDASHPAFGITTLDFRPDGCHNGHIMKNGLYSIHVSLPDGRTGKGSGVVIVRDGKIVGGDAYLFYTGSYTATGVPSRVRCWSSAIPAAPMRTRCSVAESGRHRRLRHLHRYDGCDEWNGAGGQGQPDLQATCANSPRSTRAYAVSIESKRGSGYLD